MKNSGSIEAAVDDGPRPFWSVMIPTYNPDAEYLEQTLRCVLAQDSGSDRMQIEVVDDCSPLVDVSAMVKAIAGDRIRVSQTSENLGLAGCWNTCIERSRGKWVHVLHQDDLVLDGFYTRLEAVVRSFPEAGMAFSRYATMDETGHWYALGPLEQDKPGLLDDWLARVLTGHHVECPAVIVKRTVYEHLGGFTGMLAFTLDLEMWIRIAAHYRVAYEPSILASYRRHSKNETARLEKTGSNMMDVARAFELCREYLPSEMADLWIPEGEAYWARVTLYLAEKACAEDRIGASEAHLKAVKMLYDRGGIRTRRLKLAARLKLKRALGQRFTEFLRNLRRQ